MTPAVLKNAGLLSERRLGTRRLYWARPEGLDELRRFLDDMWASSRVGPARPGEPA